MHARLQQVGSTAVPELMQAVNRDLCSQRDFVDAVTDHAGLQRAALATDQQACFVDPAGSLELVMAQGKIGFETT